VAFPKKQGTEGTKQLTAGKKRGLRACETETERKKQAAAAPLAQHLWLQEQWQWYRYGCYDYGETLYGCRGEHDLKESFYV